MSEDHVLIRSERILQQILHEIRAIRREVAPHRFSLSLGLYSGEFMSSPITSIALGGSAQLVVQLLENGVLYVAPSGAPPYTFAPSVSSNDANVTSAPATADVTSGAVPLSQQFLLTDSASDTVGNVDAVTVTAVAPDGSTITETINIGIGEAVPVNVFSLSLALYPSPAAQSAAAVAAAAKAAAAKAKPGVAGS
jgi:hypothetical protein